MTIFKRISVALLGVFLIPAISHDAEAVPVSVTFTSGVSTSSGALLGLTDWTLSFTVDNGGTSLLNQTWTQSSITTSVSGSGAGNAYSATYTGTGLVFNLQTDGSGNFLNTATFQDTGTSDNTDSIASLAAVMTTAGPTAGGSNFALTSLFTTDESGWAVQLTGQGGGDVPEPATLALFGVGFLGVGLISRRRRKG